MFRLNTSRESFEQDVIETHILLVNNTVGLTAVCRHLAETALIYHQAALGGGGWYALFSSLLTSCSEHLSVLTTFVVLSSSSTNVARR